METTVANYHIEEMALLQECRSQIEKLQEQRSLLQKEIDRLNRKAIEKSIVFEKTKAYLGLMLDEHEGIWDRLTCFESIEFATNYMAAAKHAEVCFGRNGHRINEVEAWVQSEDSLPFKRA